MYRQRIATLLPLTAALIIPAAQLSAQARSNVQGKVDEVRLDEDYLVINGERLVARESDMVVTWKGRQLRATLLAQGMTLFYSTYDNGSLRSITLIGPEDKLKAIDAH